MNRPEKQRAVERLRSEFEGLRHAFVIDFKGITVPEVSELRREVRKTGSHYQVVKNTLALRAVGELPLGLLKEHLRGPTAIAWHGEDPFPLARVLRDFAGANPALSFKAVLIDGQALPGERVGELASLPSGRDLKAKLVLMLASPLRRLASALAAPSFGLASVLKQRADKIAK